MLSNKSSVQLSFIFVPSHSKGTTVIFNNKHNQRKLEKGRRNKACKDSNKIYIEVALQGVRLFPLNMNLFYKKKKKKKKKTAQNFFMYNTYV